MATLKIKVLPAQIGPYYYFLTFPLSSTINFFCLFQFQMTNDGLQKIYLAIQMKTLLATALSLSHYFSKTGFPLFA
jgi:hypothetical protein